MRLKIVAFQNRKEYNNMSKLEKELKRLKSKPKDFTYDEAKKLLNKLEFYEEKLKLYEKDKKLNTLIDDIKDEKIKNIVNNLLKDL